MNDAMRHRASPCGRISCWERSDAAVSIVICAHNWMGIALSLHCSERQVDRRGSGNGQTHRRRRRRRDRRLYRREPRGANGFDVTLIDPWPEHVEAIRKDGLSLEGVTAGENRRRASQDIAPDRSPAPRQGKADRHRLHLGEVLRHRVGDDDDPPVSGARRLSWCRCRTASTRSASPASSAGAGRSARSPRSSRRELYAPGQVRRTGAKNPPGHEVYRVGEVHGRMTRADRGTRRRSARIDTCKVTDNLWGERWSKLCVNGMHNGVSAATGLSGNACDRTTRIRRVIIRLGGEAVRVGQAQGYTARGIIAGQDAEKLARASEGDRAALDEVEALMLAPNPQRAARRSARRWARTCRRAGAPRSTSSTASSSRRARDRPPGPDARKADRGGETRRAWRDRRRSGECAGERVKRTVERRARKGEHG